jgi:4-amino-4-deoxy-L-arabinose transferase-like glycosyltransferase
MRGRWGWGRWSLVLILLLAWALRLPPITANRFHADEAWYGYWGLLIGRGRDPWLMGVPVDKPPLLPYLMAGTLALLGGSEFAVRFPGLAAGLVTVPLAAALAWALYRDRWTATTAAIGAAFSPFAVLFSATAFTDPLMVAFGLAACVAATRSRPWWAGLLTGMALATKQTALVWLPLVLALQIVNAARKTPIFPQLLRRCGYTLFGILLVVGLVFAWDRVRVAQGAESFWRLGVTRYGGLRVIWPQELRARLQGWIGLMRYLFVSPVVNSLLLAGLPVLVWRGAVQRPHARESLVDLLLTSFCLVYSLFLCLWAFSVWDRYLLPLVPLLALLLARIFGFLVARIEVMIRKPGLPSSRFSRAVCRLSLVVFLSLLSLPAWNAAHSRYPVGGDHGAYDGIDEVAGFVHGLPEGTVVYQHWLGWHHSYYLFDSPVYLAYWPTPSWFAEDVRAFGVREPRYITFPSWESSMRVAQALAGVGYGLEPVLTTTRRDNTPSFTVYRIQPLSDR